MVLLSFSISIHVSTAGFTFRHAAGVMAIIMHYQICDLNNLCMIICHHNPLMVSDPPLWSRWRPEHHRLFDQYSADYYHWPSFQTYTVTSLWYLTILYITLWLQPYIGHFYRTRYLPVHLSKHFQALGWTILMRSFTAV